MRGIAIVICLLSVMGSPPALPSPVTNFPLVDQNGKPFQLYDYRGSYVLASFIYTRCPMPKMCPLTVTLNQQTYALWKKEKQAPLKFLLTTLDPENDTPAQLKEFAGKRGLDATAFRLATGNAKVLAQFASSFGVLGKRSTNGLIAHNLKTVLLGPDLGVVKEFPENAWKAEDVLKAMKESRTS